MRHVGKNSIFFGMGYFMPALINIILLPIYVRYITPEDYGALSLLVGLGGLLTVFMGLCVNRAIERLYINYPQEESGNFLYTVMVTVVLYAGILGGALTLFSDRIGYIIFRESSPQYGYCLVLQIWVSFFLTFPMAVSAVYLIKEQSSWYAALRVVNFFILLVLTLMFLVIFNRGMEGIFEALLLSSAVMALFYLALVSPELKINFAYKYVKSFLKYSLPLLPYNVFLIAIAYVDRFYINNFFSLKDVGVYSVASRLGMLMEVLVTSFAIAWQPFYYNRQEKDGFGSILERIAMIWIGLIIFAALAISVFAREIVVFLTAPAYYEAYRIIPVLAIGYIFLALYFFFVSCILYSKKTLPMPLVSGLGLILDMALLAFLTPIAGLMGSAACRALAYLFMASLAFAFSLKRGSIRLEYRNILKIAALCALAFLISGVANFSNMAYSIIYKSIVLAGAAFLLYYLKLIDIRVIKFFYLKAEE